MSQSNRQEITIKSFILGCLLSAVMVASNLYLGLKLGFSVAASIPAAVLSILVLRVFRHTSILEHNLVQTTASAGEVIAVGASFTLPALVMMGYWTEIPFFTTFLITAIGGCAGVLCVSLFRKPLLQDEDLTFPEGRATAEILKSQTHHKGHRYLIYGGIVGAVVKMLQDGLFILKGNWLYFTSIRGTLVGGEIGFGMALLGAGYTVGLGIGASMLFGSLLSWGIFLPVLSFLKGVPDPTFSASKNAFTLWSKEIRLIGVGMMVFGGIFVSLKLLKPLGISLKKSIFHKTLSESFDLHHKELPSHFIVFLFLLCCALVACFFGFCAKASFGFATVGVLVLSIAFLWLLTSLLGGYMSGLIGSSSSPVSGISLLALLFLCTILLVVERPQISDLLPPLAIIMGAIVTCAAAVSTNTLQSLKTGALVRATPWKQQVMLLIGVIIAASLVGPLLHILFKAYGLYSSSLEGDFQTPLAAPKAILMKGIVEALFQSRFDWNLFLIGNGLAGLVLLIDYILKKRTGVHMPVLAVALGFYMPLEVSVPTFVGGLVHFLTQRQQASPHNTHSNGLLFSAGLIAGDALVGILVAILLVSRILPSFEVTAYENLITGLSFLTFGGVVCMLYRISKNKIPLL